MAQHILSAVESEITSGKSKGDPTERDLVVTLDERGPLAALRVPHQRDDRHQKWPVSAEVMPNNKFLPTLSVLLLGH
jgi:hypothetical protein